MSSLLSLVSSGSPERSRSPRRNDESRRFGRLMVRIVQLLKSLDPERRRAVISVAFPVLRKRQKTQKSRLQGFKKSAEIFPFLSNCNEIKYRSIQNYYPRLFF